LIFAIFGGTFLISCMSKTPLSIGSQFDNKSKMLHKKLYSLEVSFFILISVVQGQHNSNNPYNLNITNTVKDYCHSVALDSSNLLVDLTKTIPDIRLDIRYATENNFTHRKIYSFARAFVRLPVSEALLKVQNELKQQGIGIKIFDAYRPYAATLLFYEIQKDTIYVAAPWKGSRHNRGCSVDLTLVDLKTGEELKMPTSFDTFSEKSWPSYMDLPQKVIQNRQVLIEVMSKHGFTVYPQEWWHFDFQNWENYGLLDIPFEELEKQRSICIGKKN